MDDLNIHCPGNGGCARIPILLGGLVMFRFWERTLTLFNRLSGRVGLDLRYFIKGGFWLSLPFVVNNLLGIARSILFARLLSKEVYGQFGFVNDTISLMAFLTLPGLTSALVETVARGNQGAIFDARRARLRWGGLLTLSAFGFSLYYLWKGEHALALAISLAGLLQPLSSTYNLVHGYYKGVKRFDQDSYINMGQSVINTGGIILTLLLKKGLVWLIVANYGTNLIYYLIIYLVTTRDLKTKPRDPEVVAYGRELTWANLIMIISTTLDGFILGITGDFVAVAVYRVASTFSKSANDPIQSLRPLVLPKIAEKPEKKIYTAQVRKQLGVLFLLNLLFAGCIMGLIYLFLPVIYGETYRGAIVYGQLLMLSLVMGWPDAFFLAALQARKQTRAISYANMVYGILLISSMLILTPVWGITGIVISKIAARWGGALYRWKAVSRL